MIRTSAPQVSPILSSAPLIVVPSTSALVVSSSGNMETTFTFNDFGPLDSVAIQGQPHALPTTRHVKKLPKFQGNNAINVQEHIDQFLKVCDDEGVEQEDATMKMFVVNLEGEARAWYKALANNSIDGLTPFFNKFLERWGDKQDTSFLLKTLQILIRKKIKLS
jgi:hypothetical protein